jgi:hypothetical protein
MLLELTLALVMLLGVGDASAANDIPPPTDTDARAHIIDIG